MQNWIEYGKTAVFGDKSKDGLLTQFLKDYKNHFNTLTVNPGCAKCLNQYWDDYLNTLKQKEMSSAYELYKKYSGSIVWNGNPVLNEELTDELAKELLKSHPRGELLFSKIPKDEPKFVTVFEIENPKEEIQEVVQPKNIKKSNKKNK